MANDDTTPPIVADSATSCICQYLNLWGKKLMSIDDRPLWLAGYRVRERIRIRVRVSVRITIVKLAQVVLLPSANLTIYYYKHHSDFRVRVALCFSGLGLGLRGLEVRVKINATKRDEMHKLNGCMQLPRQHMDQKHHNTAHKQDRIESTWN